MPGYSVRCNRCSVTGGDHVLLSSGTEWSHTMSVLPGSIREPDRVVLVRLVARGLSEGTITLEDVKGLTGREIRALLAERTGAQSGPTAYTLGQAEQEVDSSLVEVRLKTREQ